MPLTYSSVFVHCVFSTRDRKRWLTADVQERLFPYIGGICRKQGLRAMAVGGVEDHVHVLLSLDLTTSVAKAVQLIKGSSSKWLHEVYPDKAEFEWQKGYGAFSIGVSQLDDTVAYILGQAQHHERRTFEDELVAILGRHGIEFDPRYLLG